VQQGVLWNAGLAAVKLIAGVVGSTYALIADAVESMAVSLMLLGAAVGISVQAVREIRTHTSRRPRGHCSFWSP
jgi:divalent metal cation (Fe/Co/Zn/Cd) transporter